MHPGKTLIPVKNSNTFLQLVKMPSLLYYTYTIDKKVLAITVKR